MQKWIAKCVALHDLIHPPFATNQSTHATKCGVTAGQLLTGCPDELHGWIAVLFSCGLEQILYDLFKVSL
jgi:hypothetical protein